MPLNNFDANTQLMLQNIDARNFINLTNNN